MYIIIAPFESEQEGLDLSPGDYILSNFRVIVQKLVDEIAKMLISSGTEANFIKNG